MPKEHPQTQAAQDEVMVDDRAMNAQLDAAGKTAPPTKRSKARAKKDPMADLGLPKRYTDAGIRERNQAVKKRQKGAKATGAKVVADKWDKQMQARADACEGKLETWESPDPMREIVNAHPAPGMRRRFLSDSRIKRAGMRGWKPVTGKNGEPVKLGDRMILAEMSEEKAQQRNRHYQEQGNAVVRDIEQSHQHAVEKLIRQADKLGLKVLKPGEIVSGASSEDFMSLPNPARRTDSIGYEVRRGN